MITRRGGDWRISEWVKGVNHNRLESNKTSGADDTAVCTNVEPEHWTLETYVIKRIMRW